MDLKDILIAFLIILIIGTVLFGSLGSFLGHIRTVVSDVADGAADEKSFTVDFLEKNSHSISESDVLEREITRSDDASGEYSSDNYESNANVSADDRSDKNSFSDFSILDLLDSIMGSSNSEYEDYQHDFLTDKVDSEGNPIYRSIVSTSGGQTDPGIYEVYWSKMGVINHTRIR
ncbi:hypothetical protein [Methanobrevibacter millerae]|uniref:Uncharacterized protein n=1 Tax=Methanobrevibacter millerae TaxID=230361 RepID=A0A1G5XPT5_9EURY|nr:hypothetical protein [Methanobrevibacter millerae]SDA72433.1 hypothetical protein SAMN02910315_02409 [Methanobrevibacter millerae]